MLTAIKNTREKILEEEESWQGDLDIEFAMEVEVSEKMEDAPVNSSFVEEEVDQSFYSQGVQVSLNPTLGSLKVSQFENNPKAINYYTGFKDIQHFLFFLAVLGPAAACLSYSSRTLSVEDELFLCLIKLRLCKGNCKFEIFLHDQLKMTD